MTKHQIDFIIKCSDNQPLPIIVKLISYVLSFFREKKAIIDSLLQTLDRRFDCLQSNPVIRKAVSLLDTTIWPDDHQDLSEYGNDDVQVLIEYIIILHYGLWVYFLLKKILLLNLLSIDS